MKHEDLSGDNSRSTSAAILLTAYDILMNKLLFPLITISMYLWSSSVSNSFNEVGSTVWYTTDNSIIGKRPGRLFGIFSLFNLSIKETTTILYVIYYVTVLSGAFAMFLFIKKMPDDRRKLFFFFPVMALLTTMLDYYYFVMWDYASLTFFISFVLIMYVFYFLLMTDKLFLAPVFAVAAQTIDCRAFIFILPVCLYILASKKFKNEKRTRLINIIIFIATAAILVMSIMTADIGNKADSEVMDGIFLQRYAEIGISAEDLDRTVYAFKFEGYLSLTPFELISDTIFTLEDMEVILCYNHFQIMVLLFITLLYLVERSEERKMMHDLRAMESN